MAQSASAARTARLPKHTRKGTVVEIALDAGNAMVCIPFELLQKHKLGESIGEAAISWGQGRVGVWKEGNGLWRGNIGWTVGVPVGVGTSHSGLGGVVVVMEWMDVWMDGWIMLVAGCAARWLCEL